MDSTTNGHAADLPLIRAAPRGRPFRPGQSGNPVGRPKGRRDDLTLTLAEIKSAIAESWPALGPDCLRRVAAERPADYLRIVASLLPRDDRLAVDDRRGNFTIEMPVEFWTDRLATDDRRQTNGHAQPAEVVGPETRRLGEGSLALADSHDANAD